MSRRWLGLLLFVAACAHTDDRLGASSQAIIEAPSDKADGATVAVIIQHAANPTPDTSFTCSGTVVSPHVVLTAAHCLDPKVIGPDQAFYVYYADDLDSDTELADKKNFGYAKSSTFHPDFDGNSDFTSPPLADIGVIVLKDAAKVTPIQLRRSLDATAVGQSVHVIGYGKTDAKDAGSSGRRTDNTTPLVEVQDKLVVTEPAGHSQCEGDSGGTSLLDGQIVGVHSFIEHATSCTGKNYDTRVDAYASWIDGFIHQADPGFLPEADAGTGDDPPDAGTTPNDAGGGVTTTTTGGCSSAPRAPDGGMLLLALAMISGWARRRSTRRSGAFACESA